MLYKKEGLFCSIFENLTCYEKLHIQKNGAIL